MELLLTDVHPNLMAGGVHTRNIVNPNLMRLMAGCHRAPTVTTNTNTNTTAEPWGPGFIPPPLTDTVLPSPPLPSTQHTSSGDGSNMVGKGGVEIVQGCGEGDEVEGWGNVGVR